MKMSINAISRKVKESEKELHTSTPKVNGVRSIYKLTHWSESYILINFRPFIFSTCIITINSSYDPQMRAWQCFLFFPFYFIDGDMLRFLSCDKCTHGKSLWTKASAKCPKCKCNTDTWQLSVILSATQEPFTSLFPLLYHQCPFLSFWI